MPIPLVVPEYYLPAQPDGQGIVTVEMAPLQGYQFTDADGDILSINGFWVEKLVLANGTEEIYGRGVWPAGPFWASLALTKKTGFGAPSGYNGVATINQSEIDGLYKQVWFGVAVSDGVNEVEKSFLYVPVGVSPPSQLPSYSTLINSPLSSDIFYSYDVNTNAKTTFNAARSKASACSDEQGSKFYYGTAFPGAIIFRSNLDGTGETQIYQDALNGGVQAFAVDLSENKLFYVSGQGVIRVIDLSGVFLYDIAFNVAGNTSGIALDRENKKIYACGVNGEAGYCNYDGTGLQTPGIAGPSQGITVDPYAGFVFARRYEFITRYDLDFLNGVDIHAVSQWSNAGTDEIECDPSNGKLYISDGPNLRSIDYDGNNQVIISAASARGNVLLVNP